MAPRGCLSDIALAVTGYPPGGANAPLLARPLRATALALYGGSPRADTARTRSDGPKGLPRTRASPRSRGGYRPAGAPNSERAVRTGRLADPCPLNVGLFGAGSVPPSSTSNPGLPAGMGRGGGTSSKHDTAFFGHTRLRANFCGTLPAPKGAGRVAGCVVRVTDPPPRGAGHDTCRVRSRTSTSFFGHTR